MFCRLLGIVRCLLLRGLGVDWMGIRVMIKGYEGEVV